MALFKLGARLASQMLQSTQKGQLRQPIYLFRQPSGKVKARFQFGSFLSIRQRWLYVSLPKLLESMDLR